MKADEFWAALDRIYERTKSLGDKDRMMIMSMFLNMERLIQRCQAGEGLKP